MFHKPPDHMTVFFISLRYKKTISFLKYMYDSYQPVHAFIYSRFQLLHVLFMYVHNYTFS